LTPPKEKYIYSGKHYSKTVLFHKINFKMEIINVKVQPMYSITQSSIVFN